MAGEWLKMTHGLPEKPEVLSIAGKTGFNRLEIVGRLFVLWRWFDLNTTDGNAHGVSKVTLSECLFGVGSDTKFVDAVIDVGWASVTEGGICIVNFDYHISETAKQRALTAKRVAKCKVKSNVKGNGNGNVELTPPPLVVALPRIRRRSKPNNTSEQTADGTEDPRFEAFWSAYPKKVGKGAARKAWVKAKVNGEFDSVIAAVERQKQSDQWRKDGGQYIPNPATWITQERWEDGDTVTEPDIFGGAK